MISISNIKLNKYDKMRSAKDKGPAIVVLLGSFNPITYQHLRIAELAKHLLINNGYQVLGGYISPVSDYYEKETLLRKGNHRINMCRIAEKDSDWLMVDEYEYYEKRAVPTIEVLNSIKDRLLEKHKEYFIIDDNGTVYVTIVMVAGSDLLESMKDTNKWPSEDVEAILKNHLMVVISRDNTSVEALVNSYDLFAKYADKILIGDNGFHCDVSSTYIRNSMKNQQSIKYLINNDIIKYISDCKLFQ